MSDGWNRRVDKRSGDMAHGITFVMEERAANNVRAEVAIGTRKLHVPGCAALTLALGQHRYGDELIAQMFTNERVEFLARRENNGWSRVQIYMGPADIGTAEMLERVAAEIRERLQGVRE